MVRTSGKDTHLHLYFRYVTLLSEWYGYATEYNESVQHRQTDNLLCKKCFERSFVGDQLSNLPHIPIAFKYFIKNIIIYK